MAGHCLASESHDRTTDRSSRASQFACDVTHTRATTKPGEDTFEVESAFGKVVDREALLTHALMASSAQIALYCPVCTGVVATVTDQPLGWGLVGAGAQWIRAKPWLGHVSLYGQIGYRASIPTLANSAQILPTSGMLGAS